MLWLIVGGNGQLGRTFRDVLSTHQIPFDFSTSETLNITHQEEVRSFITTLKPQVVVNCAAWTAVDAAEENVQETYAVNCDGARYVARAAREIDARHVLISTDYVFPGNSDRPYETEDATGPISIYGKSKLCGENAALEEHPHHSYVVRTAWLYSQYGKNFVKTMVQKALDGQSVRVVNDQHGQPTHSRDLAEHVIDLVRMDAPPGVYHGTSAGRTTWYELTQEIYSLVKRDVSLVSPVPSTEYPTKAIRPHYSVLGHTKTTSVGVPKIQNWRIALEKYIDEITTAVKSEKK